MASDTPEARAARRRWFITAARSIYGSAWQKRAALLCRASERTVARWAAGENAPPPLAVERLQGYARRHAERLRKVAALAPVVPTMGSGRRPGLELDRLAGVSESEPPARPTFEAPAPAPSSLPPMPGEPRRRGRPPAHKHAAGRLVYADELEQHWRVLPENDGLTEDD